MMQTERKARTADANNGRTDRQIATARRLAGSPRGERQADRATGRPTANGVSGSDHNGRITL